MEIKTNTIITLENKEKYVVLNKTEYQSDLYFLVMGLDEKKEVISSKVAIMKSETEENDLYVSKVEDPKLIIELTKLLKRQI